MELPYFWNRPYSWDFNIWTYSPAIYYRPFIRPQPQRVRVKGRRGSNINYNRNETNNTNLRRPQSSQTRSNGRRSRSREVLSTQPTRSRISTPRQPRQI